jgi:NADH-quinone oxidoreductase subunit L
MFHLMTHAFFKALLFLGAGSVIHALSGEQDIMKMGGLRGKLPWTHLTFLVATLAIAGLPPLAGFFSKDEILWGALAGPGGSPWLWGVGVATAGLTAFYMMRLYFLTFAGAPRFGGEVEHHLHESPPSMLGPLVVLAVGSTVVGFLGVPHFLGGESVPNYLEHFLHPVVPAPGAVATAAGAGESAGHSEAPIPEWGAMLVTLLVAAGAILAAARIYRRGPLPEGVPSPIVRFARGKFYVDELYERLVLMPYRALCRGAAALDERIVDGLVNGAGFAADLTGEMLRLVQTGYVRQYALGFFVGTVVILYFVLR